MLATVLLALAASPSQPDSVPVQAHPLETHLTGVRQLTFGGQNAEAYWSADGRWIVYQSKQPQYPDEQIFVMRDNGSRKRLVSTGKGRCTCGFFSPDGKWIYFSSTHRLNEGPQPPVDMSKGYVWRVNPQFELWRVSAKRLVDGVPPKPELILSTGGYTAETTIAPDGRFMVFTSTKDEDLEIYRADLSGRNLERLTTENGYDGGPFVSWDSRKVVYRRDLIESESELNDYKALLAQDLVRPGKLEIWIMDADGSNKRQVTRLGCASFAPFLHPDGRRVIFSSNYGDPKGREFDLWMINVDGTGLTRITHTPEFDGFPMFTRDGRRLVWASNRYGKTQGETNIFTAQWIDR